MASNNHKEDFLVKEIIRAQGAPCPSTGPYSQAVKVDNTLYIAGICGEKPVSWELAGGGEDIKAETIQVMENLKAIMEEVGGTLDDIVSVQLFLKDGAIMPQFNEVYRSYFKEGQLPARIATVVTGFVGTKANFELNAIAHIGASKA